MLAGDSLIGIDLLIVEYECLNPAFIFIRHPLIPSNFNPSCLG